MKPVRAMVAAAALLALSVASAAVTGVVVDEQERPIAGATVWLSAWAGPQLLGQVQTDAAGKFRFGWDPSGLKTAICIAYARGYGLAWRVVEERKTFAWLVMHPAAPLRGAVFDDKGEGIAGAHVALRSLDDKPVFWGWSELELPPQVRDLLSTTTDRNGYYVLPWLNPTTTRATVYSWTPKSACVCVNVKRGRPNITLPAPATVHGTIECTDDPTAGAGMRVYAFITGTEFTAVDQMVTTADASGRFGFYRVPPGQFMTYLFLDGSPWLCKTPGFAKLKEGQTANVKVTLIKGQPEHGTVVDKDSGRPVQGVRVDSTEGDSAMTDAQGRFTVRVVPGRQWSVGLSDWPADYYRIDRGSSLMLDLEDAFGDPIPVKNLTLKIQRARKVTVHVVDENNRPVMGAMILGNLGEQDAVPMGGAQSAVSGPDGTAELTRLGRGVNYWLMAKTAKLMPARIVTIPAGNDPVDVTLPVSSKAWCRLRATSFYGAGQQLAYGRIRVVGILRPGSVRGIKPRNRSLEFSLVTDAKGRLEGPLMPAILDYEIHGVRPPPPRGQKATVWRPKFGEVKDLGRVGGPVSAAPKGAARQVKGGFWRWLKFTWLRIRLHFR